LRTGVATNALLAESRLIGFGDLRRAYNAVELGGYAHFPRSRFGPGCHGIIFVLWNSAPFTHLFVSGEWIRGIFSELFGG
jgi:hypothetical protein